MIVDFTWYPYTEKNVLKVEKRWGIYRLADSSKRVLFISKGNVKKHLPKHLPDADAPASDVEFFSIEYCDSGEEAHEIWEETLREYKKKHS